MYLFMRALDIAFMCEIKLFLLHIITSLGNKVFY